MRFLFSLVAVLGFFGTGCAADPVVQLNEVYAKVDKEELKFDFYRPSGDGPFPLVICIHGGGWAAGSKGDYKDFQMNMAKMGIASASVQYRFIPKHKFPTQIDDCTNALKFLIAEKAKYKIDPKRVMTMGGSAGGHLALLLGFSTVKDCEFKGIVNVCGPTDLRNFQSTPTGDAALKSGVKMNSTELVTALLGTDDKKAKIYETASPITMVRKDCPPVLTLHGSDDDLVPFTQASALHEALKKAGAKETLMKIKGGGHDLGKWPDKERNEAILAAVNFFKEHLKP